jgi:hypothetical protein
VADKCRSRQTLGEMQMAAAVGHVIEGGRGAPQSLVRREQHCVAAQFRSRHEIVTVRKVRRGCPDKMRLQNGSAIHQPRRHRLHKPRYGAEWSQSSTSATSGAGCVGVQALACAG